MNGIDPKICKIAISKINDGFIFEDFANSYLSAKFGYEYIPVGGIKDRGIDGLEHIFQRKDKQLMIYQHSIEKDSLSKIFKTMDKLETNKIDYTKLHFVTNQPFPDKDKAIDDLFEKFEKPCQIWDIDWLANNVNSNEATLNSYRIFTDSYLHELQQPGATYEIADLVRDPRLLVFLRQQWEKERGELQIDDVLVDSLILFGLRGTDPDKGLVRTKDELFEDIANNIQFEPSLLKDNLEKRLKILSTRPSKKINYHSKENAYCLPYETRKEFEAQNVQDIALHDEFMLQGEKLLRSRLRANSVQVRDCVQLLEEVIHTIFMQQGLEFSQLILENDGAENFDKSLSSIVDDVVNKSAVIQKNKESVKTALHIVVRQMVYNGTAEQNYYLSSLANTYMLLFLLKCDPKLSIYFSKLASELRIYVCNSILVPALSEYYLEDRNQRYWKLLEGARAAGIEMRVNETIIDELVAHFKYIRETYDTEYCHWEDLIEDELTIQSVEPILLRAYFYAKLRGKVESLDSFIDNFCTPGFNDIKQELIDYLNARFGITFVPDKVLGIEISQGELESVTEELEQHKRSKKQAENDARLVLTIFELRKLGREEGSVSTGYKTWWLSQDTTTQKSVAKILGEKYPIGCYMRPDYLYSFVCLMPKLEAVSDVYKNIFPNLLGISISYTVPSEVSRFIKKQVKDHRDKDPARVKALIRLLNDKLRGGELPTDVKKIGSFFDSLVAEFEHKQLDNP